MSDHHVRWSSFQWWTSLCWSYLLYDSRSTFRSQCSEAISAYARLVNFNQSILCVQNCLTPVVDERWAYHTRSSRGVWARRTLATVHTQGEHFLIISERSSYNATIKQNRIRCIKDKHHMQSKYVTWYGHHHLVPLISISKASSWSPPSLAWHHDLHHHDLYHCVFMKLSRQLLLLLLQLTVSNKVK